MVKLQSNSEFLKAEHVPEDGIVRFVDEGKYVEGNFGEKFNITVAVGEDTKTWTMNATTQFNMDKGSPDENKVRNGGYGDDTATWVNKEPDITISGEGDFKYITIDVLRTK